jgi:hypothetical protein
MLFNNCAAGSVTISHRRVVEFKGQWVILKAIILNKTIQRYTSRTKKKLWNIRLEISGIVICQFFKTNSSCLKVISKMPFSVTLSAAKSLGN